MIKFDISKLRVETYWVKSVSSALGGSVRIIDEEASTDEREVHHRLPIPLIVVHQFKKKHKTTKYIRPCLMAITYYDDMVIALERHPAGCMGQRHQRDSNGEWKKWIPASTKNIENRLQPIIEKHTLSEWFFDGRYAFNLQGDSTSIVQNANCLSADKRFRSVPVLAVGLHKLDDATEVYAEDRHCLAYVAPNGRFAISPPIWKEARSIAASKIKGSRSEHDEDQVDTERDVDFDRVDKFCAVNVSFALKAAKDLSEEFGYEAIEPLNLPDLMIRLNTVNLPKVQKEVKDTFDSGMKFTHALAWLLGFARRCKTLETYATIRALLKYLTSKGLYFKQAFAPENVFQQGHNIDSIPLLNTDEALAGANNLTVEERLKILKDRRNYKMWESKSFNAHIFESDPEL